MTRCCWQHQAACFWHPCLRHAKHALEPAQKQRMAFPSLQLAMLALSLRSEEDCWSGRVHKTLKHAFPSASSIPTRLLCQSSKRHPACQRIADVPSEIDPQLCSSNAYPLAKLATPPARQVHGVDKESTLLSEKRCKPSLPFRSILSFPALQDAEGKHALGSAGSAKQGFGVHFCILRF